MCAACPHTLAQAHRERDSVTVTWIHSRSREITNQALVRVSCLVLFRYASRRVAIAVAIAVVAVVYVICVWSERAARTFNLLCKFHQIAKRQIKKRNIRTNNRSTQSSWELPRRSWKQRTQRARMRHTLRMKWRHAVRATLSPNASLTNCSSPLKVLAARSDQKTNAEASANANSVSNTSVSTIKCISRTWPDRNYSHGPTKLTARAQTDNLYRSQPLPAPAPAPLLLPAPRTVPTTNLTTA